MRILVDMDGVITDFDQEFLQRWRKRHPDEFYIPLEKRAIFYVRDEYPAEFKPLVEEILFDPTFFAEMVPVPGAREALEAMEANGWEVFICSSPMSFYGNCVFEKYKWVESFLGPAWVKKLILTKDKTIIKADYLIDDRPEVKGLESNPTWEHILYDRPYNRDVNKRRLTWENWRDVILDSLSRL